jgi:hypothetical protein
MRSIASDGRKSNPKKTHFQTANFPTVPFRRWQAALLCRRGGQRSAFVPQERHDGVTRVPAVQEENANDKGNKRMADGSAQPRRRSP